MKIFVTYEWELRETTEDEKERFPKVAKRYRLIDPDGIGYSWLDHPDQAVGTVETFHQEITGIDTVAIEEQD